MFRVYFTIIFAALTLLQSATCNLRCYACSFSAWDTDQSCLTITEATNTVDCTMQYCTIMRQEHKDPSGVVASFVRGCEDSPAFLNHVVEDYNYITYFRACTLDLCNIGDGVQSVTGGALNPYPDRYTVNLLVPGTSSATALKAAGSIILLTLVHIINV